MRTFLDAHRLLSKDRTPRREQVTVAAHALLARAWLVCSLPQLAVRSLGPGSAALRLLLRTNREVARDPTDADRARHRWRTTGRVPVVPTVALGSGLPRPAYPAAVQSAIGSRVDEASWTWSPVSNGGHNLDMILGYLKNRYSERMGRRKSNRGLAGGSANRLELSSPTLPAARASQIDRRRGDLAEGQNF